jgi:hypothetical protein
MAGGLAGCSTPRRAVAGGVERLLTLNVNGQRVASTCCRRRRWR